jgi:acetoacetate decarboxylase
MTLPNPFTAINLHGDGTMRGVTLAVDRNFVRDFLPAGLELGNQDVTDTGEHPVILLFNDMSRVELSIPTLLPPMTYHEHSVGVPFTYISNGSLTPGSPGPYCFVPKLYQDNFWARLSSLIPWGFPREMASVNVTANRYTVASESGQRLTSLTWRTKGEGAYRPIAQYPNFKPVRQMLSQPLISQGPIFILDDFDKAWDFAMVRPLRTVLEVDVAYVEGFECGSSPASGLSPGIDSSVLGSYELRVPWRLGVPYPPLLSVRR